MREFNKPPLSIEKQIQRFKNRGMLISNSEIAASFLKQVSYYRFSAYCIPFEKPRHVFRPGTTFEQVWELYDFDRCLRTLINEALEVIEISVRTTLAHVLSDRYDPFMHENPNNFFRKDSHQEWLQKVHEEIARSREVFIEHYKTTYEGFPKIPLWMAVEVMSFGTLSKLFASLLRKDQIAIARIYGLHTSVISSWLHTFTYIRNVCAHHARLWNRELAITMTIPKKRPEWDEIKTGRLAGVIFAIIDLLIRIPEGKTFICSWHPKITALLETPVSVPRFLEVMGFPEKYKDNPLWKQEK